LIPEEQVAIKEEFVRLMTSRLVFGAVDMREKKRCDDELGEICSEGVRKPEAAHYCQRSKFPWRASRLINRLETHVQEVRMRMQRSKREGDVCNENEEETRRALLQECQAIVKDECMQAVPRDSGLRQ
jgi:hypothetical protein